MTNVNGLVGPVYESTKLSPDSTRSSHISAPCREVESEVFADVDGDVASSHTKGNGKTENLSTNLGFDK